MAVGLNTHDRVTVKKKIFNPQPKSQIKYSFVFLIDLNSLHQVCLLTFNEIIKHYHQKL